MRICKRKRGVINIREILFRGKRIDNGEWVEGCYTFSKKASRHIIWVQSESNAEFWHTYPIAVDPLTVGQFTGLTDKNGKKIFEGDIAKDAHHTGFVSFGEFNCSCCDGVYGWSFSNGADIRYYSIHEVIGNIHDNPELLGGDNT